MSTEYLSARQIASRLDVRVRTVRAWIRRGMWPVMLLPDGSYRVPARAFEAWCTERRQVEEPDSGPLAHDRQQGHGDGALAGDRPSWGTSGRSERAP